MSAFLELSGLRKVFPDGTEAVRGIDLACGEGALFCRGAAVARLEGRGALEEGHRRLPDYEVDHDAKVRFHSSNVTGWASLPIRFTPGGAA